MQPRVRDWAIAIWAAIVLGVLAGGVYSGVTGWTGPSGRAAAATGPGLPSPGEPTATPAGAPAAAPAGSAPVHTTRAAGRTAPAKASKAAKAPKAAKAGPARTDGSGKKPASDRPAKPGPGDKAGHGG